MRKSRVLLTGAAAATMILGAAWAVRAGGPQGPGTICNPLKGQSGNIVYSQTFGVENSHASNTAKVICPIDFTEDPTVLLGPSAIQIAYKARHPSIKLVCTAYASYEDGYVAWTQREEAVNDPNTATFDFQVREAYEELGASYFTVECSIPPVSSGKRSAIVSWESGQNRL